MIANFTFGGFYCSPSESQSYKDDKFIIVLATLLFIVGFFVIGNSFRKKDKFAWRVLGWITLVGAIPFGLLIGLGLVLTVVPPGC